MPTRTSQLKPLSFDSETTGTVDGWDTLLVTSFCDAGGMSAGSTLSISLTSMLDAKDESSALVFDSASPPDSHSSGVFDPVSDDICFSLEHSGALNAPSPMVACPLPRGNWTSRQLDLFASMDDLNRRRRQGKNVRFHALVRSLKPSCLSRTCGLWGAGDERAQLHWLALETPDAEYYL